MTDPKAVAAARRLLAQEWQTKDDRYNAPMSLKDGVTVARALLAGEGPVQSLHWEKPIQTCPDCGGHGESGNRPNESPCSTCNGRGYVDAPSPSPAVRDGMEPLNEQLLNLARHLVANPKPLESPTQVRQLCREFLKAAAPAVRDVTLRGALQEFVECAMYDPLMEGPRFKGWNRSALDRCLVKARAALSPSPPEPKRD